MIGNTFARRGKAKRWASSRVVAAGALALFAGSISHGDAGQAAPARPILPPPAAAIIVPPAVAAAQRGLEARIDGLGQSFNGDVGIAVKDLQTGWTTHYDGDALFPQQSVSKFWVTLTALEKADRGDLNLYAPVTLRRTDLTLFNQPIAQQIKDGGYTTTLADLIARAMQQSDNTANDFTLRKAGGPEAVREFFRRKRITGIRFGPGERLMQSATAGLEWRPAYSTGNAFYAARNAVPMATRRAALERYLADPVDGATPLAIVDALGKLKDGELLSPVATQRLLALMSNTKTGPRRLKGGLAPGWSLAHKTGTGQVLGAVSTGYNDIGIVTAPDGRSYSVAVMIRRTTAPIPQRMQLMQNTVRAVIAYVGAMGNDRFASGRTSAVSAGSR